MHDDQLPIDVGVAGDLIRTQFPQWQDEPITPVESDGTDNAIYRIGEHLAARFPLRARDPVAARKHLRAEAAAMTELCECSPFAAPRPVAIGQPGDGYPLPWAVQTWLPGEAATPTGLAGSRVFARDLVTLISALRTADTRGRRFTGRGRGGRLADHDEWMSTCFGESEGLLDVPRLRSLWDRFRALPRSEPDVMTHGDLIPANLLVEGEGLVGVLDGGGLAPADPALDLVAAWHLLDGDARELVRTQLQCGALEWQRGAAWAFQQAMGLVWYYRRSNPSISALGRNTLERILGDPDT